MSGTGFFLIGAEKNDKIASNIDKAAAGLMVEFWLPAQLILFSMFFRHYNFKVSKKVSIWD